MQLLLALIAKDLRRAWRNPLPWLLNLALPLTITAMIGLVFGGHEENNQLGRMKFAVVDEDHALLSALLKVALTNGAATNYCDPVYTNRDAAMRLLNSAKLSAVFVIPAHFTSNYLTGRAVTLELVKNPAEQIYPAAMEEGLGMAATGMNALSRNLLRDVPAWQRLWNGDADEFDRDDLFDSTRDKLRAARICLLPPLVTLTNVDTTTSTAGTSNTNHATGATSKTTAKENQGPKFNIFGYLIVGMAAMFLLILANRGLADLHREIARATLERYHTLREPLLPFILGKTLFAGFVTAIGAAVLLGVGAFIFHIHWPRPGDLALLTLAYVAFATGLGALLVALSPNDRIADAINNIAAMILAIGGGCMFPPEQLPAFMRNQLTPYLPTHWYAVTARDLWWSAVPWWKSALELLGVAVVCLVLAVHFIRRRFQKGLRA